MKHLRLLAVLLAALTLAACEDPEETPATTDQATLTVSRVGQGQVQSSPGGIDCGSVCAKTFASGASVTLSAAPASGYDFIGWSGSALDCQGAGDCAVTVESSKA